MKKLLLLLVIVIILIVTLVIYFYEKDKNTIGFKVLYNGFITINLKLEDLPPTGPIVFTSYEQWEEFGEKYFPQYQGLYSYMTMYDEVNFNKEYLVFRSTIGAKTWYNLSFTSVEKVKILNNKIEIVFNEDEKAKDILNGILTTNEKVEATHPNILILKVKKEDIPSNLENLYQKNKDYGRPSKLKR
ncbi:hypothetical protein BHF71_08970 [Vulcanibacillus modesticaldus]|uniref:Uncharacterized protein n=1 Tax=Vulcanibacillus modesticaldus TaxID=337097 RepID=A0A1D2YV06_9BACI|nr:hypothetical protein [Vulcanibacillus modesticaldus]OEF99485.1 hypothetical protein BHF71_08970 [Vulcanibacillus modesticaldus]